MVPEDLKNSEELKNAQENDLKKAEKAVEKKAANAKAKSTVDASKKSQKKNEEKELAKTNKKTEAVEEPVSEKAEEKAKTTELKKAVSKSTKETKSETVEEVTTPEKKEVEAAQADKTAVSEPEKPEEVEAAEKETVEEIATPEKEEVQVTKADKTEGTEPEKQEEVKSTEKETVEETATPEKEKVQVTKADKTEVTEPKKTEEVEAGAAEKIKTEVPKQPIKKEKIDYLNHSQVELVNAMRDVLDNPDEYHVREEIETIKSVFYKNLNDAIADAKQKFIKEGGAEEEFVAEEDPYEKDIKDLLKRYRQYRYENNKKLDQEKEENLKLKYQVIEDIKNLINTEESINKTFHEFRELQNKWREIGLVPQSKMKNLWDTYHFHVENFYNYIKINRELRDLDLKKNFEAKIKLCEQAEELLVEPSIIKAFNTLQKYHERWREIGPVPREHKDDIWERFKAATSKINKKHQEFFENRKSEQKKNLEAKTALCEKVEAIKIEEIGNHKEWDEKSKELVELQKVWRTIGFAPKKDNNRIYERFRGACDKFFDAKREFYSKNKELQQNNLQLKIDLCVQAESLKDSTDWRKTTQDFINIQKKWKEIGPVPRKQSDVVWKRFRAACDYFFDKKSEHFSGVDTNQVENLKLKETLIEEITNFKPLDNVDENLKQLKDFQRRWTDIGHVPFKKKDEVQNKYREAINKLFDVLNIDEEKRNLLKFRNKMSTFSESSRGQNKMRFEREKYMNKLKQLENDLVLLDNNIGFFAESKNAESLIQDVQRKIEMTKKKIESLKNKIRVIDEMDK